VNVTSSQKYAVDLLARGLNGITLTLVLGLGTYAWNSSSHNAETIQEHMTVGTVHETTEQKTNRTRSIASEEVDKQAEKVQAQLDRIEGILEKVRDRLPNGSSD